MKLIDADELLEYIKTWYCDKCDSNNGVRCGSCLMDNALIEIDRHEVVDAVPVVRCKDCKYYAPLITGEEICFCDLRGMTTYDDDFCSRGKRRKKDDDRQR